jgi:hypothetical protein
MKYLAEEAPERVLGRIDLGYLDQQHHTSTPRGDDRVRQGGLPDHQVETILTTLKEAQQLERPALKFTGRLRDAKYHPKYKKGDKDGSGSL